MTPFRLQNIVHVLGLWTIQNHSCRESQRKWVTFCERVFCKIFWTLLGYTAAKAPASPRNSTWFTRLFLLVRGWGLGTRLISGSHILPSLNLNKNQTHEKSTLCLIKRDKQWQHISSCFPVELRNRVVKLCKWIGEVCWWESLAGACSL